VNLIGSTISHYKILEKLGGGGMGVVYKAEDVKLHRTVALKFLPPELTRDEEAKQRFIHEAQAASSLDHHNICAVHEIDETAEGQLFICINYYDGETLKKKIEKGPLKLNEAIDITIQIAQGLFKAHEKGIIHRDIKPANIFITNDGVVKILDFGLAKLSGRTMMTKMGSTLGTVAYMSPEQSRGEEVDHRTDIWSLGVVLYEMITGKLPFKGDYDQAVIYSILNEKPEFPNIPEPLENILKRTIAKNPSDRYQDTGNILSDLRILINDSQLRSFSKTVSYSDVSKKLNFKWIITTAFVIIFVAVSIVYFLINKNGSIVDSTLNRKMIVVMPFENLGSQDDKYFADGVTDEITSKLASIGNIGVISASSAEKLSKTNKSTKEIGKELGVDYILNGTIRWAKSRKNESRVRITPQLTRVSDNTISWSDSYNRVLTDIFEVQNEIAQKVVDKLGGSLIGNQIQKNTPPTDNLDAYDFFLRGLSYETRGTASNSDYTNIINLFKKAIQLDSNFALAYAHLSKSKTALYWFYFNRSAKNINDAFEYAKKSYLLNPNLAEVHIAFGYYYYWYKLEYEKAIEEFSKALKIQPNNAEAYSATGYVYRRMGNFKLAIQNMVKGSSLDPLSSEHSRNLGETYGLVRNYEKAIAQYKKVIELSPDLSLPKAELAKQYILWKGDLKTAEEIMSQVKDDNYLDLIFNLPVLIDILKRNFDKSFDIHLNIKCWV
jgi:serine/threonine protein kinase